MRADSFIASKIRFKGKVSVWATAISAFIMIVSVSVASGYRLALRDAISEIVSDVVLTDTTAIRLTPALDSTLAQVGGIRSYEPVVIEPGIVRSGAVLEGVAFKGVPSMTEHLQVRVPEKLARKLQIGQGDALLAYFVGEKVRLRKFTVAEVYVPTVELDEALIVYCPLADMQRLLGYSADGLLETQINADGARHNTVTGQEQWLAFGNVHIQNHTKGEHSLTDTIYWDRDAKKIYTDCFIQMYSPQGLMQGYGMESDEKAENAIIRHPFDSYGIDRDSTYFYFDSVNFVGPLQRF